jgi:hypothetical protein
MRCPHTAGGQATGAEINACSGRRAALPDQDSPVKKLARDPTRRRSIVVGKAHLSDSAEEDEDGEDAPRLAHHCGNQLGELADSERVFPAPTSHVASLNRELKALETRYFRTRLSLEKATEKVEKCSPASFPCVLLH